MATNPRRRDKQTGHQAEQPADAAPDQQQAAAEGLADVDAFEAERRRSEARMAARVPDDQLPLLPDLELLEEARRRGVTFTRTVTRQQIIAAAVAATAEPTGNAAEA
jgi:hypothetical protein